MTGETASGVAGTADLTPPPSGSDVSAVPLAPLTVHVKGKPRTQGSAALGIDKRTGKPRMFKRDGEAEHREAVAWTLRSRALASGWPLDYTGPVVLDVLFEFARPKSHNPGPHRHTYRPDIDKLQRLVLDALTQSGVIHDDCQVTEVFAVKQWGPADQTLIHLHSYADSPQ